MHEPEWLQLATFTAVVDAMLPESAVWPEERWAALRQTIAMAVEPKPAKVQRQLALFVRVLNSAALLRHGRPLHRLTRTQRVTLLQGLERARVGLLRRGVWGLRTLIFMGCYTQRETASEIGYRGSTAGWSRT